MKPREMQENPGKGNEMARNENIWQGEGWYRIGFSDGGQDWTNDGPLWIETERALVEEMDAARGNSTDTHIPFAEYLGCGDEPSN